MLARPDPQASLEAIGLAAGPSGRRLFADVGLKVDAGEALYVAGPNGAGKTTLLRVLCGLAEPLAGRVSRRGHHLSYIGHAPALKDDLSAHENLRVNALVAGLRVSDEDVERALGRFGLASRASLPARSLSQGQRRRVSLARLALTRQPGLLVLDEPFTALDAEAADVLAHALEERLQGGSVLIYTTHQPRRLAARAHHTVRLGRGAMREPC